MESFIKILLLFILSVSSIYANYVQVSSSSGISVFLDGTFKGKTSQEYEGIIIENVRAGTHTLKLVKKGFSPQIAKINVKSGKVFLYKAKSFLPKIEVAQSGQSQSNVIQVYGKLNIQTLPVNATISIPSIGIVNNKKTNDVWSIKKIPSGTYVITVSGFNKKLSKKIKIREGVEHNLFFNLVKRSVDVSPKEPKIIKATERYAIFDNGTIQLNFASVGYSPKPPYDLMIPNSIIPGKYRYNKALNIVKNFHKAGYFDWKMPDGAFINAASSLIGKDYKKIIDFSSSYYNYNEILLDKSTTCNDSEAPFPAYDFKKFDVDCFYIGYEKGKDILPARKVYGDLLRNNKGYKKIVEEYQAKQRKLKDKQRKKKAIQKIISTPIASFTTQGTRFSMFSKKYGRSRTYKSSEWIPAEMNFEKNFTDRSGLQHKISLKNYFRGEYIESSLFSEDKWNFDSKWVVTIDDRSYTRTWDANDLNYKYIQQWLDGLKFNNFTIRVFGWRQYNIKIFEK